MTPAAIATELLGLAATVRRLSPPAALNETPQRFYEERSDVARRMADLAERIDPTIRIRGVPTLKVERTSRRPGTGQQIINGRLVIVQRRQAGFAIAVGDL